MVKEKAEHEKEMKTFYTEEYMEVFEAAKSIALQRSEDYDSRESAVEKMLYGLKSFIQEIYDEVQRLISWETKIESDADIKKLHHRLIDNVHDIINFTIYLGIYLNRKSKE